jgi:mannose-6-phosphate isomerase-like protein (cupin superfamily)
VNFREETVTNTNGWKLVLCGAGGVLLFVCGLVTAQDKDASSDARKAMSAHYEDLKWQAVVPELGSDSPQISILRVDSTTKATQLLIRTPRKMHIPMHWHSANETHTMILGTAVFEHEGKRDKLGPGGFNYIPAKMAHQAWTSEGSVVFITVDGAWDVNWAGNPPGKSDLGQEPPASSN